MRAAWGRAGVDMYSADRKKLARKDRLHGPARRFGDSNQKRLLETATPVLKERRDVLTGTHNTHNTAGGRCLRAKNVQ